MTSFVKKVKHQGKDALFFLLALVIGGQALCGLQWLRYPSFPVDQTNLWEVVGNDFAASFSIAVAYTVLFYPLIVMLKLCRVSLLVSGFLIGGYLAYIGYPFFAHEEIAQVFKVTPEIWFDIPFYLILFLGIPASVILIVRKIAQSFFRSLETKKQLTRST